MHSHYGIPWLGFSFDRITCRVSMVPAIRFTQCWQAQGADMDSYY